MRFFIERFVQFRSLAFKDSLHVRPDTLWTYVLTPSRRTCRHPLNVRQQSQRRTSKGFFAGEFDVLYFLAAISSLFRIRVFADAAGFSYFYRILRVFANIKMKAEYKKSHLNDTCEYHLWAKRVRG